MTKSVDDIIKDVIPKSPAENDRNSLQSIRSLQLVEFIDSQLRKASSENELKVLVTKRLHEILGDSKQTIDIMTLTHLLGVLAKTDNEFILGLVNTIKDFYQIEQENKNRGKGSFSGDEGEMSAELIQNVKIFLKKFNSMANSEMPERGDK